MVKPEVIVPPYLSGDVFSVEPINSIKGEFDRIVLVELGLAYTDRSERNLNDRGFSALVGVNDLSRCGLNQLDYKEFG